MAPQHKRKRQRKRRPPQKGGKALFVVDVKKGFELLTDKKMWKIPSKTEIQKAKKQVVDYKREYRASGTRESYNKWIVKKGYAKKADTNCILM